MDKNAAKRALWVMNRTSVIVWVLVIIGNLAISSMVTLLSYGKLDFGSFLSVGMFNVVGIAIGALVSYPAVIIALGMDYLISLYIKRDVIFKVIFSTLVKIALLVTLIMTIVLGLYMHYATVSIENLYLFGIGGSQFDTSTYLLFFYYIFVMGFFTVVYIMFITLLAKRYSWHFLVGTILLTLTAALIGFNEILLFFMVGNHMILIYTIIFIISIGMTYLCSRLAKRIEIKG